MKQELHVIQTTKTIMGNLNKYEIGLLGGSFQAKELKIWRNKGAWKLFLGGLRKQNLWFIENKLELDIENIVIEGARRTEKKNKNRYYNLNVNAGSTTRLRKWRSQQYLWCLRQWHTSKFPWKPQ